MFGNIVTLVNKVDDISQIKIADILHKGHMQRVFLQFRKVTWIEILLSLIIVSMV